MITLDVENVRSFALSQALCIAPLTLLTGENSSGKSSLLAILAAVFDPVGFPFRPGFNKKPYSLGNYDTIATYDGSPSGTARSFRIGYRLQRTHIGKISVHATYGQRDGQASIEKLDVTSGSDEVHVLVHDNNELRISGSIHANFGDRREVPFEVPATEESGAPRLRDILFSSMMYPRPDRQVDHDVMDRIFRLANSVVPGRSVSIAPIRSRPERVYGQRVDSYEPSGDHIPFVLDKLLRNAQTRETQVLKRALTLFGRESGLFSEIQIRKLGGEISDPFQVMVNVGGRFRNLIDVGYGVSQALPIVVEIARAAPDALVLIQQPEVHLHPRAQAALGSVFADFVHHGQRQLVIETHSDYIIDRIRQEIARKQILSNQVILAFVERVHLESRIHSIHVDPLGNLRDAPNSYRDFFLGEQLRLMERGG